MNQRVTVTAGGNGRKGFSGRDRDRLVEMQAAAGRSGSGGVARTLLYKRGEGMWRRWSQGRCCTKEGTEVLRQGLYKEELRAQRGQLAFRGAIRVTLHSTFPARCVKVAPGVDMACLYGLARALKDRTCHDEKRHANAALGKYAAGCASAVARTSSSDVAIQRPTSASTSQRHRLWVLGGPERPAARPCQQSTVATATATGRGCSEPLHQCRASRA